MDEDEIAWLIRKIEEVRRMNDLLEEAINNERYRRSLDDLRIWVPKQHNG